MSKIETVSGVLFDTLSPNPEDVRLDDIAWATSRISRFCGHTIPLVPYSVAQHSIAVSFELEKMMDPDNWSRYDSSISNAIEHYLLPLEETEFQRCGKYMAFHGLMHDAAEAYIGDIPSPVKHLSGLKEAVEKVETEILKSIYTSFQMIYPSEQDWKIIKIADMIQRTIEAYNFMSSRGKDWNDLPKVSLKKLQEFEGPVSSVEAYDRFLARFHNLKNTINKFGEHNV